MDSGHKWSMEQSPKYIFDPMGPKLQEFKKGNVQNHATVVKFEHFDVDKNEATDHHYLEESKSRKQFDANSSVSLHIMKEWRILKKCLPDSIYVRVYETRIDLLRAVIIGSPGTPYHDGLFFFDIVLPSDYPNQPPKVHYHSHGYWLNPNLYANGRVCLSLINTWSGSNMEIWRKESTILQILVSIQGLVLNDSPYFNEPLVGFLEKLRLWGNASIPYSQDAFIFSCMTMVHIMQKPPQGFEAFVAQHFREHAVSILEAVKAYEDGRVVVGQYQSNMASSSDSVVHVSSRFKANLINARGHLEQAFASIINVPKVDKLQESMNNSEMNRMINRKEDKKLSKAGNMSKKGSTLNPQEKAKENETGVWGKLMNFVKGIW